ncbi:hypothetical protein COLO4_15402 [Corchorus olitorius]|uniref:Bifunctional inhibitor/plant lipid transfer protein/seed storage helical domain-containing protein n=1 Tax=Corchorus olitorius TaxID=93759 RepID=A0A1R3JMW3_9ROSI|nr:hypothetical protein COLO4_15402 [Corchorus olitorius]
MAKLAVLLTTLALFLFLANASIRTAITVENDDENPWGHQEGSCQQQIMKQDYLKHCQNYMEEQCSGGRCDYNRERINSCCQQLQKLDRQCRCTGLKQAMQQQMGGDMGKVMHEMQQMAESVLSKCNMEPRKCDTPYENPWGTKTKTGGCSRQIEQQDYLRHCQKYMEGQCSCSCSGCNAGAPVSSRQ